MKFKFRLQKILNLRQTQKKMSAGVLGEKTTKLEELAKQREEMLMRFENTEISDEVSSMADIIQAEEFKTALSENLEKQANLIELAKEEVRLAAEAYIEDSQKAKVLENLRSKKLDSHKTKMVQEDRKKMTEIAGNRFTSAKIKKEDDIE